MRLEPIGSFWRWRFWLAIFPARRLTKVAPLAILRFEYLRVEQMMAPLAGITANNEKNMLCHEIMRLCGNRLKKGLTI